MLAGQIPRGRLDGLAAELQIDLKVISVSLREAPSDETRYSKLALVEAHLQEQESIGPVDAPSAYFGGTLDMRWGVVADHVVYFTGYSERTVVSLTWSRRASGSALSASSRSSARAVESAAFRFLAPSQRVHFLARRLMRAPASGWTRQAHPNEPEYDFTLLGTPVYVALAD